MKIIYPGSFDPITLGHLDIIERVSKKFDEVYIAILNNNQKKSLFTVEERIEIIKDACKSFKNIKVVAFSGLLVDFAKSIDCKLIVRGLREVSDYEKEVQMALMNRELYNDMETLFLVSNAKYSFVSSSIIKEIISFGGNVENFVPELAYKMLKSKYLHK
ncbi:pantetheine-phosphate adenylyltransferase [Miniphocaeibacter halophilus]|uniref:Pantetheine-phosphate adenylyltransferase n=1 Tax=Miniphocaeibacter halophilus TaxID=2931922 RepID=A0AC61MQ65_9FIRM|nr:pantetheine-phosphate adenylyltransferase [Miniphocaeibacter halophilus]QQK07746.1 pantetheine-phosphate adenylyltransferase [Miniphocaeibacter halophilus]